jgi:NADPH:quinone reductase-like Zn-dependent oxidoreductase
VQITRCGGPEVLDVVDLPDPTPGEDQQLFDVSTAGVDSADTHHALSWCPPRRQAWGCQRTTT